MAVSVDTVYKTVLYILNKAQRGFITPDEVNKLGEQVQLEILQFQNVHYIKHNEEGTNYFPLLD